MCLVLWHLIIIIKRRELIIFICYIGWCTNIFTSGRNIVKNTQNQSILGHTAPQILTYSILLLTTYLFLATTTGTMFQIPLIRKKKTVFAPIILLRGRITILVLLGRCKLYLCSRSVASLHSDFKQDVFFREFPTRDLFSRDPTNGGI